MPAVERTEGNTLMDDWVASFADRNTMADAYADLLQNNGPEWKTWPTLNLAILDRWSKGGLSYIKEKAWAEVARREASA